MTGQPAPGGGMLRRVGGRLSARGAQPRLLVLMYHRVLPATDPLFPDIPDRALFAMHMAVLARHFRPLPLDEAVDRLAAGELPPASVCVTFDDGYADNHDIAAPILERHGIPATFFVAPGFIDGGCMWNDAVIETIRAVRTPWLELDELGLGRHPMRSRAGKSQAISAVLGALKYLPPEERALRVAALAAAAGVRPATDLMMTSEQVRAMRRAGHSIGAHTMRHPILTRIDDDSARRELADSKARLESLLDAPVDLFAYPNGAPDRDYTLRHVAAARELGFKAAASVSWGAAGPGCDFYQIPRIWPWDRSPGRFTLRLWRTYFAPRAATASAW